MRKQAPIRVALHLTSRGTWNLKGCYSAWPAVILRILASSSNRPILCFISMFSFIRSLSTLVSEASSSASAYSRFRIYQKPNISALARAVSQPPRRRSSVSQEPSLRHSNTGCSRKCFPTRLKAT